MQGITPSRLPPITTGFHVSTIQSREQPRRSWARFKKLLIDTPKDNNLLKRQKLWNFQKLNRGAFRSQIRSLPEIPYRVNNGLEHVTVGTYAQSADDSGQGIKIILPTIEREKPLDDATRDDVEVKTRDQATSPMHSDDEYKDDFEGDADDESVDDPGYEFDYCVTRIDISTMTDKQPKKVPTRKYKSERKEARKKILKPRERTLTPDVKMETVRKIVTFADDEIPAKKKAPNPAPVSMDLDDAVVIEKVDIVDKVVRTVPPFERLPTPNSVSSASSISMEVADVGHTSQRSMDPLSIIDFLSGRVGDNRTLSLDHRGQRRSQNVFREKKLKERNISDTEADRIWFEKIVGDRDVIDLKSYDNFSRMRPSADSHSDSNNEPGPGGDVSRTNAKKMYTPRVSGEYPITKSTHSNAKYYPVFSKDGTPIRKHGGTPPKVSRNIQGRRNTQGGKSYE